MTGEGVVKRLESLEASVKRVEAQLKGVETQLRMTTGAIHAIASALGIREKLEEIAADLDELQTRRSDYPVADVREG